MEHAGAKIASCIGVALCGPMVLFGIGVVGYSAYGAYQFGKQSNLENELSKQPNQTYVEVYNDLVSAKENLGEYEIVDNEKVLIIEEPNFEEAFDYLTEVSNGISELREYKLPYPEEVYDISEYVVDYNLNKENSDNDLENILELREKVLSLEKDFRILAGKQTGQEVGAYENNEITMKDYVMGCILLAGITCIPGVFLYFSIDGLKEYYFGNRSYRPRRKKNKP